jgi:hypothetical protein
LYVKGKNLLYVVVGMKKRIDLRIPAGSFMKIQQGVCGGSVALTNLVVLKITVGIKAAKGIPYCWLKHSLTGPIAIGT